MRKAEGRGGKGVRNKCIYFFLTVLAPFHLVSQPGNTDQPCHMHELSVPAYFYNNHPPK